MKDIRIYAVMGDKQVYAIRLMCRRHAKIGLLSVFHSFIHDFAYEVTARLSNFKYDKWNHSNIEH